MEEQQQSVIVVGAGSAGSVVARRLVDAGIDVTLFEAGGEDTNPAIHDVGRLGELWHGPEDWDYYTVPMSGTADQALHLPRGRVLGGSHALNATIWVRCAPSDFDGWAEQCGPEWAWRTCCRSTGRSRTTPEGPTSTTGPAGPSPWPTTVIGQTTARDVEAPLAGVSVTQTHLFARSRPDLDAPDTQPIFFSVPMHSPGMEPVAGTGFTLYAGLVSPRSRGEIRLTGPGLDDPATIDLGALSDPADAEALLFSLKQCRGILRQPALAEGWGAVEAYPGPEVQTDEELVDYIQRAVHPDRREGGQVPAGGAGRGERGRGRDRHLRIICGAALMSNSVAHNSTASIPAGQGHRPTHVASGCHVRTAGGLRVRGQRRRVDTADRIQKTPRRREPPARTIE